MELRLATAYDRFYADEKKHLPSCPKIDAKVCGCNYFQVWQKGSFITTPVDYPINT
jgi:hypothetical protein